MDNRTRWGLGGVAAAVVIGVGIWLGVRHFKAGQPAEKADEPQGVAVVTTATIKTGLVSQTVTAYGNVTAEPGVVTVLSASVECRVRHLRAAAGQAVDAGAAVVEIEPSPDAKLQLIDARNALESAKKDSAGVHQRFELKLATNAEVQTSESSVRSAQAKLDDLTRRGAGDETKTITADTASVVGKVDVQEGQLVPAGGPLVELVPVGRIEVRLGVQPNDALLLRPDQPVQLFPSTVDEDEPVDGKIRLVTRRVNPDSRLVDVFTAPADTNGLLLDGFVRGELTVKTVSGLVIPHDALLPDDQGFSIFTVVDAKAVKHSVHVAVQNDKEAIITGDGLHDGDVVIVTGALELDDKVPVKATAATTAPAAEDDK